MSFDSDTGIHYYPAVPDPVPFLRLRDVVRRCPSALVGYSGGVDSALLAVVLRQELGRDRMLAVIDRSASYPEAQERAATALAARFDVPVLEIDTQELDDPSYLANPTNRCFYCKTELWTRLGAVARQRGMAVVCDGTNADDLAPGEHRPGHAAGIAAGVRSPLAEAGMTKADVRAAARGLDLPVWDAPSAPCLSSRVRYGVRITRQRLRQVEDAEAVLRGLGVTGDLRVRHHGDLARIEVEPRWIPFMRERMVTVGARLRSLGFAAVELDPAAEKLDEGKRFPLCQPERLTKLFTDAGLRQVEVTAIDIPTSFVNFDDYWQPFLGGQGPAPGYAMSLATETRNRLRDRIRERLPMGPDGSILLTARAWAIRVTVAK